MNTKNICGVPFSEMRLYPHPYDNNKISLMNCCSSWLEAPYNEYTEVVPETSSGGLKILDVWNSERIIKLRKSVSDGSYRYCKLDQCPNFISKTLLPLPDKAKHLIESGIYKMDYLPLNIHACIDKACNLCCPTCRKSLHPLANEKTYNWLKSILDAGVGGISLNGTGEVFKNRYILDIISNFKSTEYPNLKQADIITNGTLLNKVMWSSLSVDFKKLIRSITVSVDAGSKNVYRIVRPGGDFDRLKKNLKFIGGLKRNGEIKSFIVAFVLQRINLHELIDFAKLAKEVGADTLSMTIVEDWSTYSHGEFLDRFGLPKNFKQEYHSKLSEMKSFLECANIKSYTNVW